MYLEFKIGTSLILYFELEKMWNITLVDTNYVMKKAYCLYRDNKPFSIYYLEYLGMTKSFREEL